MGLEGTIETTCAIDAVEGYGGGALTCEADPNDDSVGKWKITKVSGWVLVRPSVVIVRPNSKGQDRQH